jgi:hypothetical protein
MTETIRHRLRHHMLWSNTILVAIAFFGFALPLILPIDDDAARLTMGLGVVALLAWGAFARRFPCPKCRSNIGGAFGNRAAGFAPSGRNEKPANACPHCGVSLDASMPNN